MCKKWSLFAALALGFLLSWTSFADDYDKMTLVVPKGDPQAGRAAFVALGCTSCHHVDGERGDDGLPAPVATIPIPVLGAPQAKMAPGKLASAIVTPSHKVSLEVAMRTEGELSPMADFTDVLTVRQLVDLVAFIRTLDVKGLQKQTAQE